MSEKYDGVRVVWDGKSLRQANTRNIIPLPKEVAFPSIGFEGVLWYESTCIVDLIV
jgi:hypothetical protein